ncbi:MAG TPA: DUF4229 domain-containing protein [Actinoplanes sp.]|nr:DUF4229 domain-containing protein [Actinoplanes sp.]
MRSAIFLVTARLATFLVVFLVLTVLPLEIDIILKMLIAMVVSMVISFFLLRRVRQDVGEKLVDSIERRRARKGS